MSDPRTTPDRSIAQFEKSAQINDAVVNLFRSVDGPRDRQLLYGDKVTHLGNTGAWAYVRSNKDGYHGYVSQDLIGQAKEPTHWVMAPSTNCYMEPDFKSPDMGYLSFGSQIRVEETLDGFAATEIGFIPSQHLQPVSTHLADPSETAALFLGTPYLWGGNSRWGIDCSGLIQAALLACGMPCPGDSDMQMALGADATGHYRRNDLLFWKGHVALVTGPETLIHANAYAMAVNYEPIAAAIERIKSAGDGPMIAHRRL